MATPFPKAGDGEIDLEEYQPLPDRRFDVTDTVESVCALLWCPCCGWTAKTLVLDDQEATLRTKNCCGARVQRRPYAQLGSVEKHSACGCCFTIGSDLAPVNEKGEGGIKPGLGCDEALINDIVGEMQARKEKRGSIAQIKKLEFMYDRVMELSMQVPLLRDKLGLSVLAREKPKDDSKRVFDVKQYDVSNWIEMLCGCTTKDLLLEREEAILEINKCFGICEKVQQKREYAQLGSVEAAKACFCCTAVTSDLGEISPQCGCASGLVSEIVDELQSRMTARGNIGQIQKQETMIKVITQLSKEMPEILAQLGIAHTPPEAVVVEDAAQQVEEKNYDVTNYIESCLGCLCTLGLAGCTKVTLDLKADEMFTNTTNCLVQSKVRMPYAQMGSVDMNKFCCCCFSVNGISPGFGCDSAFVDELSKELQARKVKRGNIAQIKQLETMQGQSVELDKEADLIMDKGGIQYPPDQETMTRVYGEQPPKVLSRGTSPPHIEPKRQFEQKTFDVTNYIETVCTCICSLCTSGPTTRTLDLEAEEAVTTTQNWCCRSRQRTPYAQLGSVETETACCCCSELPELATPGCGCQKEMVDEIAAELQVRKVMRGNIAQLKMQENILLEILRLSAKMGLILDKHEVAYPPSQETMARLFPGWES